MMVWEYFTHFHKSALCYTDVHVYRATSLIKVFYIICDSLVCAHQNVVSIHVNDKSSNFFILKVIT